MNCVILQPSYIPWRGFFDLVHKADTFIFYDDVQYDEHGWRNRNRIKSPNGPIWLTVPVMTKGVHSQGINIKDIRFVANNNWRTKHLRSLEQNYAKAPHFKRYQPLIETFYGRSDEFLADFTIDFTVALARELGITHTRFLRSSSLPASGEKTDRLIAILKQVGARHYISGPSARAYIEPDKFAGANITLEYITYDYPEYPQLHGAYEPQVSVLDLLFMTGPDAPRFIWAGRPAGEARHPVGDQNHT